MTLLRIFLLLTYNFIGIYSNCFKDESLEHHAKLSSRSLIIYVDNQTNCILKLIFQSITYGEWTRNPPHNIPAQHCRAFGSQSNGFLTGTNGGVDYKCFAIGTVFHLTWDNPFVGKNKINSQANSYLISRSGGTGDNAIIVFTITEK